MLLLPFLKPVTHPEYEGAGICFRFSGKSNRLSRRMLVLEEMLVDSNYEYGQDKCSLSVVKTFCCGGNNLGAF